MSSSIKSIAGFEAGELIGAMFDNLIYPGDREGWTSVIGRYQSGNAWPIDIELRLSCKSGEERWRRVSVSPIRDDGGFKGLRGILCDITDKKKAEEALRDNEERYRAVWDISPIGISLTDKDCVYHYVNPAYCKMYGYSREELIGRPFYEVIFPAEDNDRVRKAHNSLFEAGKSVPLGETEFIRKGGERVWVEYTADFVRKDGSPVYLVSMNVDITQRKTTEKALKESEKKYRLLLDNTGDSIVLIDESGTIILLNTAAARILGGKPDDYAGKTIRDFCPEDEANRRLEVIRDVIRNNSSLMKEYAFEFGGEARMYKFYIHPLFDSQTGVRAAQVIAHDISEEKRRSSRDAARMKLLDNLRNANEIDDCLQYVCDAVYEASLFQRCVITLHDDNRRIIHLGQRGLDPRIVKAARTAPPPGDQLSKKLAEGKYIISHSYFVPAEAGIGYAGLGSQIKRQAIWHDSKSAWKDGDKFLVPVIGDQDKYIGWLSVDTPFDGLRPAKDTIVFLEEIVDVSTQHIRTIQGRNRLADERRELEEKNVALNEVMASIEEEKMELKNRIADGLDISIMPILGRLVNKNGTLNRGQLGLLKKSLENLASKHGGISRKISRLTSRESEICDLIKDGATNKTISLRLAISIATVKKHRESIRRKLGLRHKGINLATYLLNL